MTENFDVVCPCCKATLRINSESKSVIHHEEAAKKPLIEDLTAAVSQLKGEAARRAELFEKSFDQHRQSGETREKRFEELLKKAKESPDSERPERAFDFE